MSTRFAVSVSSSPGILKDSPYTSSVTDACKSALKAVRIPRRTRRSPTVHCLSAWHMMATFSVWWKRSTSTLAEGWLAVEFHTIWPGSRRVVTQTDVPGRW
jgi:hypothetical protein